MWSVCRDMPIFPRWRFRIIGERIVTTDKFLHFVPFGATIDKIGFGRPAQVVRGLAKVDEGAGGG
jgi:hypothetical protein